MSEQDSKTEQAILSAAQKIFVAKGYAGAQMQKIADLAGVNKALIHYYFRSKQKLFDCVVQKILSTLMAPLFLELQKPVPIADKVKNFVNSYMDTLNDNPHIPLFMLDELSTNKEVIVKFFQDNIKLKLEAFVNEIMVNIPQGAQAIDPRQLFVNFISMLVFPFVAKDIFCVLFNLSSDQYRDFLNERKQLLFQLVDDHT